MYRFLKDAGSRYLQFVPIVERQVTSVVGNGLTLVAPDFDGAAAVMAWMRQRDLKRTLASAGRNNPCPCGSGRKFTKCCGADR